MKIKDIKGREVFDSRGNPTVEAEVHLDDNIVGRAIVPSGASKGEHEAVELRDDEDRLMGKGVQNAVNNVNTTIRQVLLGMDAEDQEGIDREMIEVDGTVNKRILGANAILAVSMATAVAEAKSQGKWLFEYLTKFNPRFDGDYRMPVPMMNVINGGKHAPDGVDMQEFMVMPHGAGSFREALEMGIETFHNLKDYLHDKDMITLVGDEGGFAPEFEKNAEAITAITKSLEKAGYQPGEDASIALDPAISELYDKGTYRLAKEGKDLNEDEMIEYWVNLVNMHPIVSIEDLLDENAWEGWSKITERLGENLQIVGDDFLVTNTKRLKKAIETKAGNSILVKVNQIGTVTEAIEAINMAHENDWSAVVSHRSGETEDTFIADLVVAMGTGQIKTGSGSRTDRIAKYNQILRIEEYLGVKAYFEDPFNE